LNNMSLIVHLLNGSSNGHTLGVPRYVFNNALAAGPPQRLLLLSLPRLHDNNLYGV
jgi:hypothetical protein